VRLGFVAPPARRVGWSAFTRLVARADALGLDAVLLDAAHQSPADPLVLAAALAGHGKHIRVVAEIPAVRSIHPLHLAERIAVADQCLAGRLVVTMAEVDTELLDVLHAALHGRPFRYDGRWTIPARLPENTDVDWQLVRVTPTPAQLEVPIWAATDPVVVDWHTDAGARDVAGTARAIRAAGERARVDHAFVVLDPDGLDDQVTSLAQGVRPRVQLDELPTGIEEFWAQTSTTAHAGLDS